MKSLKELDIVQVGNDHHICIERNDELELVLVSSFEKDEIGYNGYGTIGAKYRTNFTDEECEVLAKLYYI